MTTKVRSISHLIGDSNPYPRDCVQSRATDQFCLSDDVMDYVAGYVGEAELAAAVGVG